MSGKKAGLVAEQALLDNAEFNSDPAARRASATPSQSFTHKASVARSHKSPQSSPYSTRNMSVCSRPVETAAHSAPRELLTTRRFLREVQASTHTVEDSPRKMFGCAINAKCCVRQRRQEQQAKSTARAQASVKTGYTRNETAAAASCVTQSAVFDISHAEDGPAQSFGLERPGAGSGAGADPCGVHMPGSEIWVPSQSTVHDCQWRTTHDALVNSSHAFFLRIYMAFLFL